MGYKTFELWSSRKMVFSVNRCCRFYSSGSWNRIDFKKLRPMILKRIENRAKDYPVKAMVPVAQEVIKARTTLYQGVSTLIQRFPISACKHCSEVYVGESGHLIRTCGGFRRRPKVHIHEWINGGLKDILVPVEAFHLRNMFQKVIEHNQRFDYDRIPAVVELCWQAGAFGSDEIQCFDSCKVDGIADPAVGSDSLSAYDISLIAVETLKAWESLRSGVEKLLLVYPTKVCEHCSEVHVGPSGHRARLCGVFKYESWRGKHFWRKAKVDDLVRPKIVWYRRPQDPPLLNNEGRDYYGHAPAVVDLCTKAGAIAPAKYHCMMKLEGLTAPT
ncbi:OLC1v1022803C1 [Oldenlandia corymbosa var. corymbosa]|uniref:OLC1v1022803C1 n=1 Tax=Oldenlandia corymbosa var. corymbosa TaxID=529605 RepID=A0AAV1BYL8_OLDCO|nr:OLC1v1022803C1 [Oldenlandia corymbosa var. corymbosa]